MEVCAEICVFCDIDASTLLLCTMYCSVVFMHNCSQHGFLIVLLYTRVSTHANADKHSANNTTQLQTMSRVLILCLEVAVPSLPNITSAMYMLRQRYAAFTIFLQRIHIESFAVTIDYCCCCCYSLSYNQIYH
eukprot:21477-Heterococcus_DN1.PRE.5